MKKIIFIGLLFAPTLVFANVRINEIAWMGMSAELNNDEWVELYNDSDTPQDVTGWTLSPFKITKPSNGKLSGVIAPHGYFLLERTDDTSVPDPIKADAIYTGAMVDGGEVLTLNDLNGKVDSVDVNIEGTDKKCWPAGNLTTRETMQWSNGKWITAPRTPKAENGSVDTGNGGNCKTTTTTTDTSDTSDTSDTTSDTSDKTISPSSTLDTSAHVSPLPLSVFSQKQELYISAGRNRIVSAGSPVLFEAYAVDAKGTKAPGISSVWSFGDGGQAGGATVTHTYIYPGDYTVILNGSAGGNTAVSRAEVKVFAPKITFGAETDSAVSLTNDSPYEVNIGGWKITGAMGVGGIFSAPSDTIIKAGKKVVFSKVVTGIDFSAFDSIKLLSPDGAVVASYAKAPALAMMPTVAIVAPPVEIPIVEKKSETVVVPEKTNASPIVAIKPKMQTQTAATMIAVPEKVAEKTNTSPAQTITLKKPEGFFAKVWNFLFRGFYKD